MILTLTANPSLDRTIELTDRLVRGNVQRASATHEQPGGKGVNVSRALIASNIETLAILPGDADDPMLVALRAESIPTASRSISGRIRSNITLTEPDGTTTKINEPGPTLTAVDELALLETVVAHAGNARWLVLAGSLPPGLAPDFYAEQDLRSSPSTHPETRCVRSSTLASVSTS
jgi:1-phosphofructokinase